MCVSGLSIAASHLTPDAGQLFKEFSAITQVFARERPRVEQDVILKEE